jgi:predicted ATP-dependent endonuclease of OLD family
LEASTFGGLSQKAKDRPILSRDTNLLKEIRLENYRGFREHTIPFNPTSIIIGSNNAGKSTIVEALRLVSLVTQKYKSSNYRTPPGDSNISRRTLGIYPSIKNAEITFKTIFNHYSEPPAKILATFENNNTIEIYVLKDETIFAVVRNKAGQPIINKQQASKLIIPEISILPQVAPLHRDEKILTDDYVNSSMSSRLAPLHFRNQLKLRYDLFHKFKHTVEETWPGVMIDSLLNRNGRLGEEIYLDVRNEDFVAEIAEMGHGLQMWLQTIWFLTLSEKSSTVILDEPDVYMHADLQRRIIRYLRNKFKQTILTTHSVEIMSEVQPEDLLVINKKRDRSDFAIDLPSVQTAIQKSGSVHNIHLARLLGANKVLLVEGDDVKLLKEFQDTMFPGTPAPLQAIPNMDIGGWSGWKLAIGTSLGFKNALGHPIRTYCILDSDFHTSDEIQERLEEARRHQVELHIWSKKEIENFLLIPEVIQHYIKLRKPARLKTPSVDEIKLKLISLSNNLEDSCVDALATEYLSSHRAKGLSSANQYARSKILQHKSSHGHIIDLVSGKTLLSSLSGWSKEEFGVSFSPYNIAHHMSLLDIPIEIRNVLSSIEENEPFPLTS